MVNKGDSSIFSHFRGTFFHSKCPKCGFVVKKKVRKSRCLRCGRDCLLIGNQNYCHKCYQLKHGKNRKRQDHDIEG